MNELELRIERLRRELAVAEAELAAQTEPEWESSAVDWEESASHWADEEGDWYSSSC
jgi:hypothetical protein